MKLHSLTIENFRAIEHLELKDLPETGVVVIHGNNEAGKSTILDAVNLVLTERHSTKKQDVRRCAPAGRDVGPEVELTATVGDTTFTIRKRWLRQAKSELTITAPRREQLSGEAADKRLEGILKANVDTDLARMLFLRQGELEAGAKAAGIPALASALQAASGASAEEGAGAGVEDTALMAAVEREYTEFFQPKTGKPKAGYAALSDAVSEAEAAFAEAKAVEQQLAGYVEEVARNQEEIRRVDAELPEREREASELALAAAAAAQVLEKAERASERRAQAEVTLTRAEQDVAAREALAARVAELAVEHEALAAKVAPAREARDAEAAKVAELGTARDEAKAAVAAARARVKEAGLARDLARAVSALASRDELLARVAEAHEAYTALLQETPALTVTDTQVRELEEAQTHVTLQEALRDSAAAKLDITAAGKTITVDGEAVAVDGTVSVAVFEGTTLSIGGVEVVYRAGQGSRDPNAAVEHAKQALAELLESVGCASVEEARAARDASREHAAELAAARRRLDDVLAGGDVDALRAERDTLAQRVEQLREQAGAVAGGEIAGDGEAGDVETGAELANDGAAADAAVAEAEVALADAERAADNAEAALKPFADNAAATALITLETRAEAKGRELSAARGELEAAGTAAPAEQLQQAAAEAKDALDAAEKEAAELETQAAEASPDVAERLAQGARNAVATMQERRSKAHIAVTELTGRIELAEGAAERADKAEAELEKAKAELERTTRRAEAAKLLRETMVAHRDAARARYTAPFNDAIRRHAALLYGPSVDFNLGEELEITARTLDGTTVPLEDLSGGAKEQLAILTRFAIADVVSASGNSSPVPVVVDDALGATDPDRLGRMNLLFDQVGENSQVIVLTCYPQRFDRVNAAMRVGIEQLKLPPMQKG